MVLLDFSIIVPPFQSPQVHVGGRTRGNRTLAHQPQNRSKSTTEATPIRWGSASKLTMFSATAPHTPYSHFVRNEQLRHAWQLAFVKNLMKPFTYHSHSIHMPFTPDQNHPLWNDLHTCWNLDEPIEPKRSKGNGFNEEGEIHHLIPTFLKI